MVNTLIYGHDDNHYLNIDMDNVNSYATNVLYKDLPF
jgi:hypothetical protein